MRNWLLKTPLVTTKFLQMFFKQTHTSKVSKIRKCQELYMRNLRQLYGLQLILKQSSNKTMCAKENWVLEVISLFMPFLSLFSQDLLNQTFTLYIVLHSLWKQRHCLNPTTAIELYLKFGNYFKERHWFMQELLWSFFS